MRKERRKLERDAPRCAAPVKTISFAVTQQVTPAGLSYSALSTLTRFLAQRCISDTGHRWPIHLRGTMCNCGVVRSTESLTKTVTDSLVGFSLRMFNTFIPSNSWLIGFWHKLSQWILNMNLILRQTIQQLLRQFTLRPQSYLHAGDRRRVKSWGSTVWVFWHDLVVVENISSPEQNQLSSHRISYVYVCHKWNHTSSSMNESSVINYLQVLFR